MSVNEKYIEEIVQEQLLSNEEEQALAAKIKLGDAKALEKLTKANLKFVVSLAHHYKNQGLGEDDLVSEGNIGMMHAAQKFDGTKGIRFVSYAAPYIKKARQLSINYRKMRRANLNENARMLYPLTSPSPSEAVITLLCSMF